MKTIALAVAIGVGVAVIVVWQTHQQSMGELWIGETKLTTYIADEPHEREVGLGGRATLSPDAAMLFIFPESDRYGIWMKDMQFPIDIVWLDDEKEVVAIQKNVASDTYPEIFYPSEASRYVVELASGSVQRLEMTIGSELSF